MPLDIKKCCASPELIQFASWLYGYKSVLKGVVEIGVATGASALLWNKLLVPEGIYLGIDINLHDPSQGLYARVQEVVEKYKDDKRMKFLIADSGLPDTFLKAKDIIGDKPIDFLYIDGEHSIKRAREDYDIYTQLVESGGIVAWHDATRNSNVRKAIQEIMDAYEFNGPFKFRCQFDAKEGHCGIVALAKE